LAPVSWLVFSPADTLAARLANKFPEAASPMELGVLMYAALVLLGLTLLVNFADEFIIRRTSAGIAVVKVKDKLHAGGLSLSGGQQQRLCIARAVATEPEVLLMDEPCSALDPIATRKIEDLMPELKRKYTIAIVTHNLQQARRVADRTAFLYVDTSQGGRTGYLVEFGDTGQVFEAPREKHAQEYIRGEFS